jgi:hypothetical protein
MSADVVYNKAHGWISNKFHEGVIMVKENAFASALKYPGYTSMNLYSKDTGKLSFTYINPEFRTALLSVYDVTYDVSIHTKAGGLSIEFMNPQSKMDNKEFMTETIAERVADLRDFELES